MARFFAKSCLVAVEGLASEFKSSLSMRFSNSRSALSMFVSEFKLKEEAPLLFIF